MLKRIAALPADLGKQDTLLADNGYFSEARGPLRCGTDRSNDCAGPAVASSVLGGALCQSTAPENPTPLGAMSHRLQTPEGKRLYALRKQIPEPVFGIIKSVMGFRQFFLRGLENVQGEWSLVTTWNINRMFALTAA